MVDYDVIVLGSGSAAGKPARAANNEGWEVAIVESGPVGGTCALRGCMPKKVYLAAAEVLDWSERLEKNGIDFSEKDVRWEKIQEFKSSFTDSFNSGIRSSFEDSGIDIIEGRASFVNENAIEVDGKTYTANKFVIATGNKPRPLDFEGSEYLVTSKEFLELEELPDEIVFVGGGYISFEFGFIAAKTGSNVKILQRDDAPLPMFEKDIVDKLLQNAEEEGIEVILKTEADAVEKKSDRFEVHGSDDNTYVADMVVHGAGRVPQIDDLALEKANIERTRKGVKVDNHLQSTSNPDVYAAGDCAASNGYPLTPIATIEGEVVKDNLVNDKGKTPDYEGTATALFSLPPVSSTGLKEDQVRKKGFNYAVKEGDTTEWFSASRINEKHSGYKILIDEDTDEILGAHFIGHNAEEVINIFSLAIRKSITVSELKKVPWAYPTMVSDIDSML